MLTTNSLVKINEDNSHLISTINNNEIYEKIRPLKIFKEHQAHGDDTHINQEKPFELFSYETSQIPPKSSSSDEFSFEMAMRITDTSNEALKTDDENGMTKHYFLPNEQEIILSDVSLQQQLPIDECEYEIDLGNGWITKSISSYQSDQKHQQRTTSIISADSIQPISTFKIPFTNTFYKQNINSKQETTINYPQESNVLDNSQQTWRKLTIFSIGITIIIFLIIVVFFVF